MERGFNSPAVRVAIVGATGAVGRRMVADLEYFGLGCYLELFASERSVGQKIKYCGQDIAVQVFSLEKMKNFDFVLMSAGGAFSKENAQNIARRGCVVIDNSSAWRMDETCPLIVPEVNGLLLKNFESGIIANPNCSTIQLVVSLKPLMDHFGIEHVSCSTYQSVSGSGNKGMTELESQIQSYANNRPIKEAVYPKPIFNNLIPAIDVMREGGHCFEEEKMVRETRKILDLPDLEVLVSTVRVPVMSCHSEAVTVRLKREISRQEAIGCFKDAEGVHLRIEDDYEFFPYPANISGRRDVWVGRVRLPFGQKKSKLVQYWNVADNLNKGAATNALQILKSLI